MLFKPHRHTLGRSDRAELNHLQDPLGAIPQTGVGPRQGMLSTMSCYGPIQPPPTLYPLVNSPNSSRRCAGYDERDCGYRIPQTSWRDRKPPVFIQCH